MDNSEDGQTFSCSQPNHHVKPTHSLLSSRWHLNVSPLHRSEQVLLEIHFSNHREYQGSTISTFLTSQTNFAFLLLYSDPQHQMEMHRFCKGTYLLSGVVSLAFLRCLWLLNHRQKATAFLLYLLYCRAYHCFYFLFNFAF